MGGMGDAEGASRGSTGDAKAGVTGGRLKWLLEAGPGRIAECIASGGLCGEGSDRLRLSFRVQSSVLLRTCSCSDERGSWRTERDVEVEGGVSRVSVGGTEGVSRRDVGGAKEGVKGGRSCTSVTGTSACTGRLESWEEGREG